MGDSSKTFYGAKKGGPMNLHKQMRMGGHPVVSKPVTELAPVVCKVKKMENHEKGASVFEKGGGWCKKGGK